MADSLTPSVVDIQLGNVGQQRPEHAGPSGRLTSLVNGEIVQYVPPSIQSPPKNTIRQRPGFISLPSAIRSIDNGGTVADDFHTPQLLAPIGDQLISIAHSVPRVYNGLSSWAQHDEIVATQTLSHDVIHTTNKTVQAPDSAWLQGVECVVWNEADPTTGTVSSFVGFRAENGAWLVAPKLLVAVSATPSIIRVVASNSTQQVFFVVCPDQSVLADLRIHVFDVNGVELGSALFVREWTLSPGFWDLSACSQTVGGVIYNAAVVQPGGWSSSDTNVATQINFFNWDGFAVNTTIVTYNAATTSCVGQVAWLTKQATLPANTLYFATVGAGGGTSEALHAYEVTDGAITHSFTTGANTVLRAKVDGLTGYAENFAGGPHVGIAVSLLSPGTTTDGPKFDPGLRTVVCWQVERSAAINLQCQHNGVLLQSRAFEIDDHWHAITFYQSGPGTTRAPVTTALTWTSGDKMWGAAAQPISFEPGASLNGGPNLINDAGALLMTTQHGTFTHNAGDSVTGNTATWVLNNISFDETGIADPSQHNVTDSYLTVTGATPSSLNTTWRIVSRPGVHTVITEAIGGNGSAIVDSNLAGSTIALNAAMVFVIPVAYGANGQVIPAAVAGLFIGGSITPAGAANAGNNSAFAIEAITQDSAYVNGIYTDVTKIRCTLAGGPTGEAFANAVTLTATPGNPINTWRSVLAGFNQADVGSSLSVAGAGKAGVGGVFLITAVTSGVLATTPLASGLVPYIFSGSEVISIAPAQPLKFFIQSANFDSSYLGSLLSISNAANAGNNGTYVIRAIIDSHTVLVQSATGVTGQRNETFANTVVTQVQKAVTSSPALQPTWFVSPLNNTQQTVGRFENGLAFGDWRFDADVTPNVFLLGLASVSKLDGDQTLRVTLPYRAESFTADQTIKATGSNISSPDVLQATVGLKDFAISPTSGEAHNFSGTMLLPGLQASQFNVSGFTEQGVSLFFEQAFLVNQSTNAAVIGITPGSRRQYVIVAEVTDQNGERVFSVPSQVLDVQMSGTNNQVVIAGRLIGPTTRVVGVSIYATAWTAAGIQTTQHYKVTNDLDVNGAGFNFTADGYSYAAGARDTWRFTDHAADGDIQSHEILYTDKGLLPRFPCPAFSRAATWQGRVVALAYDGALWLSGEKTEGDALWFHPGLRVTLPTESKASTAVLVDDYLMLFGPESFFYLPSTTLPDNTGQNGSLPTPVQLQFQGGCSGPAVGSRDGALYFNPASGGVWQITRGVTNAWFSEDIKDDLTGASNVTGLAIDGQQRVYVASEDLVGGNHLFVFDQVSKTWWRWDMPSPPLLVTTYRGLPVYQDDLFIMMESPAARFDSRNGVITAVPMSIVLSSLNFDKVRSFKRCWAMQITGKVKGSCTIHATISYPDELGLTPTVFAFNAQASPPPFEINPEEETASSYGLTLATSFEGVQDPGDSFEFEVISCEVGLEPGINRTPDSQRKAATSG